MNVEQLKAELTKREITFKADEIKADLQALLAADDAAKSGSNTQGQGDDTGKDLTQDEDVAEVDVICNLKTGRRRVGRRWPAGKTTIKMTDLTDDQWQELDEDPMFHFKRPE